MRRINDNTGRFSYRPYYLEGELDYLCEDIITSYMVRHSGALSLPIPTDRLMSLIERDAEELDIYADLTGEGDDVQGLTEFKPGERPVVSIDARLSAPGREHRLRTTLAHEYGHVLLHNAPFQEKAATGTLFDAPKPELAKCKRDTIVAAAATDWLEWQAGYVCGALIMPRSLIVSSTTAFCDKHKCKGRLIAGSPIVDQLAAELSAEFQVSCEAASVRLSQLGMLRADAADISLRAN